ANLFEAGLQEADLHEAELQGVKLFNAQLPGANLYHAKLQGADFWLANLVGTDLRFAELQGADLRKADLGGASLAEANLRGADLRDAQLLGAGLHNAQLQGADLRHAGLWGANLSDTQLQGANLDGAILTLAKISHAQLWRTSGVSCDDAWVNAPQFSKAALARSGTETQGPSTAAAIESLIEETVRTMPESGRQELRERLRGRLIEDRVDDGVNEQAWRACAEKVTNEDKYIQDHVAYLLPYVCEFVGGEESRKTVLAMAKGFYRVWVSNSGNRHATALSEGLAGRGGTPCPNAKELDKAIKEMLRKK